MLTLLINLRLLDNKAIKQLKANLDGKVSIPALEPTDLEAQKKILKMRF